MRTVFALFLICTGVLFAKFEEGTIHFKLKTSQAEGTMELKASPEASRTRLDIKAEQGIKMQLDFLMRHKEPNLVYQMNPGSKSYSVLDLSKMPQGSGDTDPKKIKVKKLGEEKVLGYKTSHVMVETPDQTSELWITKDIDLYETLTNIMKANPSGGEQVAIFKALEKEGLQGFPLKSITQAGEEKILLEVTKIDAGKLPKNTFEIPKDYKKAESNQIMMEQMMNPENMKALQKMMEENMTPAQREALEKMMREQGAQ